MAEFHFSFSFSDQKLDDRQCKMKTDEMNFRTDPAKFHFLHKFLESPEPIPTCTARICRFCTLPLHPAIWQFAKSCVLQSDCEDKAVYYGIKIFLSDLIA